MFNIHLTANFMRNLPVKKNVNRLRFGRIMVMSLWPRFLAHPVRHSLPSWMTEGKIRREIQLLTDFSAVAMDLDEVRGW